MNKKTVCVIGLGYIGLPTAALIANKGYLVSGIDVDEDIVSKINKCEIDCSCTHIPPIIPGPTGALHAFCEYKIVNLG